MRLMEFGDKRNKAILLIHGAVIPWQMWMPQIEHFSKSYFVMVPVLDGHDTESESVFTTVEQAASDIARHCATQYGTNLFAVCGMSLGGTIVSAILEQQVLRFEKVIMESAPLVPMHKLLLRYWKKQTHKQIDGYKARNKKAMRQAMRIYPQELHAPFLALIDHIKDETVARYCDSVFSYRMPRDMAIENIDITYWHGTVFLEVMAKLSAKFLKRHYPRIQVKRFAKYNHCELSVNRPQEFIVQAEAFLGERC